MLDLCGDAFVREEEALEVAAQGNPGRAPLHPLRPVGRLLQNRAFVIQLQPPLVHVIEPR